MRPQEPLVHRCFLRVLTVFNMFHQQTKWKHIYDDRKGRIHVEGIKMYFFTVLILRIYLLLRKAQQVFGFLDT